MMDLDDDRLYDLPPKWDGADVEWSEWRAEPWTSADFHQPAEPCAKCGRYESRAMSVGAVDRLGETERIHRYRMPHPQTGRIRLVRGTEVPAWPIQRLVVFRCNGCGHDSVWDNQEDVLWNLDDSDYGELGSVK